MSKDYSDIRILLNIDLFNAVYRYSDIDGAAHQYTSSNDGRIIVEDDIVQYDGMIINASEIKDSLSINSPSQSISNASVTLFNKDNLHEITNPVALESATATLLFVRGDMYDEILNSISGKIDNVSWDKTTISFDIRSEELVIFKNVPEIILEDDTFQRKLIIKKPKINASAALTMRFEAWGYTPKIVKRYVKYINHPLLAGYAIDYWKGSRIDVVDADGAYGNPEDPNFCIGEFAVIISSTGDQIRLPVTLDRFFTYTFIDKDVQDGADTTNNPYEMRSVINNTMKSSAGVIVEVINGDFATDTDWVKVDNWTIGSGLATCTNPTGVNYLEQTMSNLIPYTNYKVTFTIEAGTATKVLTVQLIFGDSATVTLPVISFPIVYTFILNSGQNPTGIRFSFTVGTGTVSIDHVSVEAVESDFTMMILKNPIPENSDSIGRPFPIVYGKVEKMWAVWSISTKSTRQNSFSAGDDLYVIAGHKIYDRSPTEVLVYYGLDESIATSMATKPGVIDFIPNPLPRSIYEIERWNEAAMPPQTINLASGDPEKDVCPLHKLVEITTSKGDKLTAIKLRGDEYTGFEVADDGILPTVNLQPQFPIRYGLGNCKVFVSFRGYSDENGELTGQIGALIENPADIIKHFLLNHTNINGDKSKIDEQSFADSKAELENWRFGVAITDITDGKEILERLCQQSKSTWFFKDNKIYLKVFNLNNRVASVYLEEKKHFTGNQTWNRPSITDIYNDFILKYGYNAITENYDHVIIRNKSNDQICRDCYSKFNVNRSFDEIECPDIYDAYTANALMDHYVSLYAISRTTFQVGLRLTQETIGISPGDIASATFIGNPASSGEHIYLVTAIAAGVAGIQAEFLEI